MIQTEAKVSTDLPKYTAQAEVSGEVILEAVGTFEDAVIEWDRDFRKHHPKARMISRARLSTEVFRLLTEDSVPMVLSTREMTPQELAAFQTKHGYTPVRAPICLDPILVIVNKGNPIDKISIEQLDAIFSSTRKSGTTLTGSTWAELGLVGEWGKRPIVPFVRSEGSALYAMFAKIVMGDGKYKPSVQSGSDLNSLVESVVLNSGGISFVPMGMWYTSVKVIPVVSLHGKEAYPPSHDAVLAGNYPLVRAGYLYVNRAPGKPVPGAYQEVVRYLMSRDGQSVLALSGFLPAPAELLLAAQRRLH